MVIAAHPDDEGIFFGGTLPYYTQTLNLPVTFICMTVNWLKSDGTQNRASKAREMEMKEAAWRYGLRTKPLFAYFQQNIRYWPIEKTWDRWADNKLNWNDIKEGKERASKYIAEQIRLYKPEVIITHGFNGEYGNPDHKALALAVTAAYDLAADRNATIGDSTIIPENLSGSPWQTKKLYVHYSNEKENYINNLFHDYWETGPRDVANYALSAHESQGRHYVSSVYDNRGRKGFNRYPSELWTLYRSEVGPDKIISSFTIQSDIEDKTFENWARGDFLQNLPGQ
ncbi:MAG: PIG-L family deacetylase [Spirochaetaceae bacterium]|jgi:LmbE family N-acetylglucosaminyl deacetylase|nr:PIG-L family deacetylase [Spirochaetaceae bacterium]